MTGVQSLYFHRKPLCPIPLSQVLCFNFSFYVFSMFFSLSFFLNIYIYIHILLNAWIVIKKKTKKWMHSIDRPPHFFFPPIRPPIIYWWALLIRAPKPCAYKRRRNRGSIPATPTCFPSKFPRVLDPVGARQQFRNTTITDGLFI